MDVGMKENLTAVKKEALRPFSAHSPLFSKRKIVTPEPITTGGL
jgi:hypothetical protein